MKRRSLVLGAAAVAGGSLLLRPKDEGAPHDDYFSQLNEELKKNGPMRPSMVIDLDRLDQNIDLVNASMRAGEKEKHYRVVAKSIPSAGMIDYVMKRAGTRRLMAFHQPFLNQHSRLYPNADILLGKPMPVRAAELYYQGHGGAFVPERQLQWLLDTPARLSEYLSLAQGQGLRLQVNIELNVGLHRGGVTAGEDLAEMLSLIQAHPDHLVFSGFMGYDPHVVKVPSLLASRDSLLDKAMTVYAEAIEQVKSSHADLWRDDLTLNTAGSPTYKLHEAENLSNDIAVGSALVKPTDFDIDTLDNHLPAAFIAAPVLKTTGEIEIPGLDGKSKVLSWWDINQRTTYFTYGGYWKARPHSPQGLRHSALFGRSTNQEMLTGSPATGLSVNDHVFLRPTQSEFVFLQFGDLIVVRNGRIVDSWPVFDQSA